MHETGEQMPVSLLVTNVAWKRAASKTVLLEILGGTCVSQQKLRQILADEHRELILLEQ